MQRSKALTVIASQIVHVCPYKGHDVHLAMCYRHSQDITDEFCYGCDYVPYLKRKFGLRTFRRKIVQARCQNCDEYASLHESEPPYRGTRVTTCPGFNPSKGDSGALWVALDKACTEWMVVDPETGQRRVITEQYGKPYILIGAPETVPPDWRDSQREIAAKAAAFQRAGGEKGNTKLERQQTRREKGDRK